MAAKFDSVGQLYIPITNGDKLQFKSPTDGTVIDASPEDSLRSTYSYKSTNVQNNKNLVKNITKDITNPRRIGVCPGCKKEGIIAMIRIGKDMDIINGCLSCEHVWPGAE
jgi:hypothetical protein